MGYAPLLDALQSMIAWHQFIESFFGGHAVIRRQRALPGHAKSPKVGQIATILRRLPASFVG